MQQAGGVGVVPERREHDDVLACDRAAAAWLVTSTRKARRPPATSSVEERRCGEDMLEVVQHQQQLAPGEPSPGERRPPPDAPKVAATVAGTASAC